MNKDTKNKKNRGIDVWRSSYLPVIDKNCEGQSAPTLTLPHGGGKNCLANKVSLAIREGANVSCATCTDNGLPSCLPAFRSSAKKAAFTLAEVLITLGIIGVVAAVTMPTLVQNYRKHVVETKLAKFYSIMNQAQQRSIIDNGEFENWELLTSDTDFDKKIKWFNKYFGQYLSGTEIKNKYVLFPDGSAVGLPGVDANLHFKYVINFNDVAKGNLQNGKNAFNFLLKQQNISYDCQTRFNPYHCNINEENAKNDPYEGCYGNPSVDRYNCARLIQINGWKIPKDYPIKF